MWNRLLMAAVLTHVVAVGANADPPRPDSECEHHRAGWPQEVSPLAIRTNTPAYRGGYTGGGCVFTRLGKQRTLEEGTWGWDYCGWLFCRRVFLNWWHGLRCQGGTGAYQTDGPKAKCEH